MRKFERVPFFGRISALDSSDESELNNFHLDTNLPDNSNQDEINIKLYRSNNQLYVHIYLPVEEAIHISNNNKAHSQGDTTRNKNTNFF